MRKTARIFLSYVLAAVCLFAVLLGGGRRALAAEGYYASVTAEEGAALMGQLHDLITSTHTRYTSYSDCRDRAAETDPPVGGGAGVLEFYTHETVLTYIGNSGRVGRWNREHVWPKSLSHGLWGEEGGGSDMHHIRPSESAMNSARGNDKFGEVPNGSAVYSKTEDGANSALGGRHAGGVFEPTDEVKGDVARIVMYVYLHYNTFENVGGTTDGGGLGIYFGTLAFSDVVSARNESAAIALLLAWNELDPVDDIERTRNEAVYKIQGNRNPFIDRPAYAAAIWGGEEGESKTLRDFRAAAAAIVTEGELAVRFASLQKALGLYFSLTEEEKALAEAEIGRLREAVGDYDRDAAALNGQAEDTVRAVTGGRREDAR